MVASSYFLPSNNVLRFVVNDAPGSPTGLDVYGGRATTSHANRAVPGSR